MTVTNKWTHDTVGWNTLRANKPGGNSIGSDKTKQEKSYIDKLMSESKLSCDFCTKNRTAIPLEIGRIENPDLDIYTAANVFPYFDTVGLVIPKHAHDFRQVLFRNLQKCKKDMLLTHHNISASPKPQFQLIYSISCLRF